MENTWLTWAKQLQGIASTGIAYSEGAYDTIRYEEVAAIANAMLATLGSVPIARISNLVSDFAQGYATPKVDVRGAVIEDNAILLVREVSDGLWTLPGGFADIGVSPSENVVKEIWEEAGIRVSAQGLYGIRHKAKHDYAPDVRNFYKLFFVCRKLDDEPPSPGLETTEVGFFPLAELPALSTGRVLEKDLVAAFEFAADPTRLALFD
ncbi:MAG: NUDIX hydrolase [Gammaproteobacteria bacterium]|nr:NUDIX hydrolase [Gammaproteobacteria bacterium]